MKRFLILFSLVTCLFSLTNTLAQGANLRVSEVIECPVASGEAIPSFSGPDCRKINVWQTDPQNREIWLKAVIPTPAALRSSEKPAGLYISAKASSEVLFNGRYLGANGAPAANRAGETPGRMDAIFYVPKDFLATEQNEILIRMSSHHGFVRFGYPVHIIALGEYRNPTDSILNAYWPSLIPFGVLIAGGLYFAAASINAANRLNTVLLASISFAAAAQLITEVFRGLAPYAYPVQEWRVILIVLFSLIFGLSLAAHVIVKFLKRRRRLYFVAATAISIISTFFVLSYDGKAAIAVLAPTSIGAAVAVTAIGRRALHARLYALALIMFAIGVLAFPNRFLDTLFFYETATLVLVLFVLQAISFQKERGLRAMASARAQQLEAALRQAEQDDANNKITIKSAGKIELIAADVISHCKGAGDYVELFLNDGRQILHHCSLAQLEEQLPGNFLRVHRSFLVNTNFVQSLKRENSGIGELTLKNQTTIPVSRRIMPQVRTALS